MTRILLLSTYDLGRQPFGLASPAAWLREARHEVTCLDLTRTRLSIEAVQRADLVGVFLPMHTATRMALPVLTRVREVNPAAHICAYGLYAPLNARLLRDHGVMTVLGAEFEQDLVDLAERPALTGCETDKVSRPASGLPRLLFRTPDRSDLPHLSSYASLQVGDARRIVGYTEGSRGCKHRCRHCPIVPVYDGRFRIVAVDVVLADVGAQVRAGAQHISFGDPDFFNGPRHALAIVEGLARDYPGISYDVTIKVEHLRQHRELLPRLRDTGCAFVTTAVESLQDDVLAKLEKGHTRADFEDVVATCRAIGLNLSPTFVAFTPWTTAATYCDMLKSIDALELVHAVAPIQYAIRLLIPQGSRMLELSDVRQIAGAFDPGSLTHPWRHPDPGVDGLQRRLEALVGSRLNAPRAEMFARIREVAGLVPLSEAPLLSRAAVPYLNEPWYC